MKGIIAAANPQRGMVAVQTPNGYSVFENLSGAEFENGDQVQWEGDTSLGDTPLRNLSQGYSTTVYFQNHWVPPNQLKQQLLM